MNPNEDANQKEIASPSNFEQASKLE